MTTLVPSRQPHEHDFDSLRSQIAALEATLVERSAEVNRLKADLGSFKTRYREQVGSLHDELDDLELAIAEAELGELSRQRAQSAGGPAGAAQHADSPIDAPPRYTSDGVRRLFRDVAKAIHPDLAGDEVTRDRRHTLMIEANRAYALGDEERLRSILRAWETSPEAVAGTDAESIRLRLVRRITQLEEELERCGGELHELKDSPVWKLKTMVDEASAKGRDLVADTVRRLKRDVMVARNRLDAIRGHR